MKKIQTRYCGKCEQPMPCETHGPNHVLHVILSVVTFGWWLIIYALLAIGSLLNPWRCQKCRSKC